MVDPQSAAVLFPLLFVVVLKFCDVARSIDLADAADGEHWDAGEEDLAAAVRPFTLLHGINFLALLYVFVGVTDAYDGSYVVGALTLRPDGLYFYLGVVVLLLWLFLPLFEVQRYHAVSRTSAFAVPRSLWLHVGAVAATAAVIRLSSPVRDARPNVETLDGYYQGMLGVWDATPGVLLADAAVTVVLLALVAGGVLGFCRSVRREAESIRDGDVEAEASSGQERRTRGEVPRFGR